MNRARQILWTLSGCINLFKEIRLEIRAKEPRSQMPA